MCVQKKTFGCECHPLQDLSTQTLFSIWLSETEKIIFMVTIYIICKLHGLQHLHFC